jgi:hypothetical protein
MNRASTPIVLGCATDYSADQIRPFASTLRKTGFSGQIGIVIYRDQLDELAGVANQLAVTLIPTTRVPQFLPDFVGARIQNRNRMGCVHRAIAKVAPAFCRNRVILRFLTETLRHFYHISCGRYFIYFRCLEERRRRFSHVLITDVRDVIFQSDPFRYAARRGLYCFLDPTVHLGDEALNTRWMVNLFGEKYYQSRKGQKLFCSGTVLGDRNSMIGYLHKMCLMLIRVLPQAVGQVGDDQAAHNFLLWEGDLPDVIACENGENAVMTLKNADAGSFVFDENGSLLNLDGSPAPVLHQYDFHSLLKAKVV